MKECVKVSSHCHMLNAGNPGDAYKCNGCKERGIEWRYACRACNYDMHEMCATAPLIIRHPLTNAEMRLHSRPVVNKKFWCSACERSVLGMFYCCSARGDVLHPRCARLIRKILRVDSYAVRLSGRLSTGPCNECVGRTRGWAYVSTDYGIHVHCLKKIWEGRPESGVPRLSSGRCLQLKAPTSNSYHRHPQAGSGTSGVLQKYEPKRSDVWLKGFCKITKLLVTTFCAVLFGDPFSLSMVIATLASGR